MAHPRIAFKAGRAFRREGTNFVDADPTKGAVILHNGEDGLLHFIWKNRSTNEVEEDLILFPTDATFQKVEQSAWGRTYVLKFSSSDQRHFFWMQDADPSRDAEFVGNVNRLLLDPQTVPIWYAAGYNPGETSEPSTSSAPAASRQPPAATRTQAPQDALAQLRSVLASGGSQGAAAAAAIEPSDLSLTDILTPANLTPLFASHPEVIAALLPHLPADLPTPPSQETIQQIIQSPQFRSAVRNLDQALRTGLLGGLVRGLGLPEEAGTSVEAFLRAIQEQARQEGDGMDTD